MAARVAGQRGNRRPAHIVRSDVPAPGYAAPLTHFLYWSSSALVWRSRCDSIVTSLIRILAPRLGFSITILTILSRDSTPKTDGSAAMHVAKRGSPSIIDISPRVLPRETVVMCCCAPADDAL